MTRITFQDGKVVMRDDKVGTGEECCCGGCGCYKIDYVWDITDLYCDAARSFSGSVLIKSVTGAPGDGEIQCYTDPDVVSVDVTVLSQRKMTLNYGDICGFGPGNEWTLTFICDDYISPGGGAVVMFSGILDDLILDAGICCGESLGTFTWVNPFPDSPVFQNLTITISEAGPGDCNCEGYTPVTPA